ncbi:MAG TPA: glycosyltransferase family 87 protein [Candidatus Dormibacteraeota bacterium]|nr:glycosyltransferase family 87 protein [Candidatus Dormibacteraeota bacterium]
MIDPSRRWRNLGIAAGGVTAVLFALFDLYQWAAAYAGDRFHNDFTFYYVAAKIGLAHGWSSIYNLQLQQAGLNSLGAGITIAQLARYISPPPLAWLAVPFTALPYEVAYWTWSLLLIVALVLTWQLAAPGEGRLRVIFVAAALAWLPVIYGLQLGQPGLFVAAGVAGSYALLRSGRPAWAGVALGVLALKPQLGFLVPAALLAARQYRTFAFSAIALGALGLISVIALGPNGFSAYLDRLNFASDVAVNRELTLGYRPVQIVIAAWTLAVVYRLSHRGPEWVYATALIGGLLSTPYAHLDDFVMLGLAGWLVLRAETPRWTWVYLLGMVLLIEGEPIWGPAPVLIVELGALGLVSWMALRAGPRPPQSVEHLAAPRPTQELPSQPDARPSTPLRG